MMKHLRRPTVRPLLQRTLGVGPRPLLAALLGGLALGCTAPERDGGEPAAARDSRPSSDSGPPNIRVARPAWTKAFEQEAFLVAEVVEVDGPPGLLERSPIRQDDAIADYSVRAVPGGLVHEIAMRGTARGQLHAQLDNWTIVAERRIRFFRRDQGDVVRVRATGNAVWREIGTGQEKRGNVLDFVGERP